MPLGITGARFFYTLDALPVSSANSAKHCRVYAQNVIGCRGAVLLTLVINNRIGISALLGE